MTALVVTLRLDAAAHDFFNDLRTEHFPPARLVVGAHVTLFHAIPLALEAALLQHVERICADTPPFTVAIKRLRFLGRGVAYDLASAQAAALRAMLASCFAGHLSAQDSAPWSPHVTIQNKVAPDSARATLEQLRSVATPSLITATGIAVWRYLDGPWAPVGAFAFATPSAGHGQG